jgi:hypothetical protein
MRTEDAIAVDDLIFLVGHYGALYGPPAVCALLHDRRVIFSVLEPAEESMASGE